MSAGNRSSIVEALIAELQRRGVNIGVKDGMIWHDAVDARTIRLIDRHRGEIAEQLGNPRPESTDPAVDVPGPRLRRLGQCAHPEASLFLIPAAGSGPATYRGWADAVPANLEVMCVHLPGREDRFAEEPFTEVGPLAQLIAREVAGHLRDADRPFVLFGHSAGALIAYEVAWRLGDARPAQVVVAASPPPDQHMDLSQATEDELLGALREWGGTPEELLGNREFVAALLPRLRADLSVAKSCYRAWDETARLTAPVFAINGRDDASTGPGEAASWARWTTGDFSTRTFEGDHYFPIQQAGRVISAIVELLESGRRGEQLRERST